MDFLAARALVQRYVDRWNVPRITDSDGKVEVVIFDEFTLEKPYGWVFFVNSVIYQETRDFQELLVGGGPLIVRRDTGELHTFGSVYSLERYEAGTIPLAHIRRVDVEDEATFW